MKNKIDKIKQEAIEKFEKRFITSVDWGFNFSMKDFEIFIHSYQDELEKAVREEIIENFEGIKAMDREMLSVDEIIKILTNLK